MHLIGSFIRGIVFIALFVFLSITTYIRGTFWSDLEILWMDTVSKSQYKPRPHYLLGLILNSKGSHEKALDEFDMTMKLLKEEITFTMANVMKEVGVAYLGMELIDKAVETFRAALARYPFDSSIHDGLAISLMKAGNIDEAMFYAEMAVKMAPRMLNEYKKAAAHNTLGEVYLKKGYYEKAFYHFNIALKIDPYMPIRYWNIALALEKLGRYKEAYMRWKKFLEIETDEAERKEVLEHIREVYETYKDE